MVDVLKLVVAPLVLLLAPLVWTRVEPSLTRSSRLRRRISDHQALADKLPTDSEAANNLRAEIGRQVNELVHYWETRRSKAAKAHQGQPVSERMSLAISFTVATIAGAAGAATATVSGILR